MSKPMDADTFRHLAGDHIAELYNLLLESNATLNTNQVAALILPLHDLLLAKEAAAPRAAVLPAAIDRSYQQPCIVKAVQFYHQTWKNCQGTIGLLWGIGLAIKPMIGFWPHLHMQHDHGLSAALQRSLGMREWDVPQHLPTEMTKIMSLHDDRPVIWRDALGTVDTPKADLHEVRQVLHRAYHLAAASEHDGAPIACSALLIGRANRLKDLRDKMVYCHPSKIEPYPPMMVPLFDMDAWLNYLQDTTKGSIQQLYNSHLMATHSYTNMFRNYAALMTVDSLLADFVGEVHYRTAYEPLMRCMFNHNRGQRDEGVCDE